MSFLGNLIVPWDLIHNQRMKDTEQDRMSNEEFQTQEDFADEHNLNEVGRQTTYLKGMTPTQVEEYNKYQEGTYSEDTRRQNERIKDTAKELGMSPWELNGGSAASPLPSPTFMQGATKNTGDYQSGPILQAQLNARTQRDIAAMQAVTQLATTQMQTGTSKYLGGLTTAGGKLPQSQVDLNEMQLRFEDIDQDLRSAELASKTANTTATISDAMVRKAQAAFSMLPKDTTSLPGLSRTETPQAYQVLQWLNTPGTQKDFEAKIRGMGPDNLSQAINEIKQIIGQMGKSTISGARDFSEDAAQFLKGLVGQPTK